MHSERTRWDRALRPWFWVAWAVAVVLALGFVGFTGFAELGGEGQPVNLIRLSSAISLAGGTQLGQRFVAPRAGLQRIDVLLYGYFRRNTQPVTFHLRREGAAEDEVTRTFNASEVWGWRWMSFRFDPLPDSEGQAYVFFFESPTSTPDDGLTLGGVEGDLYPHGTGLINGQPVRADAAFMTYYDGVTCGEKLTALMAKLTGAKPSIWGDIRLYVVLGILYVLLMLRLLYAVYRLRQ
jgi:hypothetical protein